MPLNEKIDIEIDRKKMTVALEGIDQLQASALAAQVSAMIEQLRKETGIIDSQKLALLAALNLADEVEKLKAQLRDLEKAEGRQIEEIIVAIDKVLDPAKPL
jgi:cell division protein ZapA (FtsZ GTPase activity inhibitor)